MKDLSIVIAFHQCQGIKVNTIQQIADIVFSYGFEFQQNVDGQMFRIQKSEDVEALVHRHLKIQEIDTKTNTPKKWRLAFPAYPRALMGFENGSFEFKQFDLKTNRLRIGGLLDFEFTDHRLYVEPYAQTLKDLSLALYELAKPGLGLIDNEDKNSIEGKHVSKLSLSTISWVNFFGPEYVKKYGAEFFLNLPGYRTARLGDGGVFHQLYAHFVTSNSKEAKMIRSKAIEYCASHELKVKCYAPYELPSKVHLNSQPKLESMSDKEFLQYLDQILSTTFILDDGTRVKSVFVEWEMLTPSQKQIGLQIIQQSALMEIEKATPEGRIRFEFNEIIPELHHMLSTLKKNTGKSFEWTKLSLENSVS